MPNPPDATTRADALLDFVEQRVAYMLDQSRQAVRAFFGDERDDAVMLDQAAGEGTGPPPTGRDLARFAPHWRGLVPADAALRAALGHAIGQRYGIGYAEAGGIRAALGLDEPAVATAHAEMFGAPPAASFAAHPPTAPVEAASVADAVAADLEWVSLHGGEVLFRQGDEGDALYIVVNGRLRAVLEGADGSRRTLSEMGRGEMVGEMAVMTGQPRSATIEAVRDTELVRLSKASFDHLVDLHPRGVMQIARMLVRRLQRQTTQPRRASTTLASMAVVPGGDGAPLGPFVRRLVEALSRWGPTLHLNAARLDADVGPGASSTPAEGLEHSRVVAWLSQQEGRFRYIVYEADAEPSAWTERCIRQSDRVLVVADSTGSPGLHAVERAVERLAQAAGAPIRQELVLLHAAAGPVARGTAAWLTPRSVATHHHVHMAEDIDFARLVRRLTGRAVGLALSGGGARGYVFVGAMRAIRELSIPVDVVGGTSVGSVLAAEIALEWDDDAMRRLTRRHWVDQKMRPAYTFPFVSLSTGAGLVEVLREAFGDTRIEDLRTRYFAVASNLTLGEVKTIEQGPIARAVRMSISVPGLVPPVTEDGQLFIDGGPLNNLPLDIAQRICEGGPVIAINCNPRRGLEAPWDYGETLRSRDLIARSLLPWGRRQSFHSIAAILERTTMITGVRQATELPLAQTDLYLHPPTDDFKMFDPSGYERSVDIGYEYTRDRLAAWKERAFGADGP